MQLRLLFTALIWGTLCLLAHSQPPTIAEALKLRFSPTIDDEPLTVVSTITAPTGEKPDITLLRFYISGITLYHNGQPVWTEENSDHLLDAEDPESLTLNLHPPTGIIYSDIHFNLGIDSVTSTTGAHGGDLDPAKGMYWAWQSGYINFKLEGYSPASTARKQAFQFHLGGYKTPFSALQPIALPVKQSNLLTINMDLSQFIQGLDLAKQNTIMIPGEEAVLLSKRAAAMFKVQ